MHGVKVLNVEWENPYFSYPLDTEANRMIVGQAFYFNARWKVEKHLSYYQYWTSMLDNSL